MHLLQWKFFFFLFLFLFTLELALYVGNAPATTSPMSLAPQCQLYILMINKFAQIMLLKGGCAGRSDKVEKINTLLQSPLLHLESAKTQHAHVNKTRFALVYSKLIYF